MKKGTHKTVVKKNLDSDLLYMKEDRMLKKIEKYVNKNREKTSKKISERKSKRPVTNFQEADLEVMISRIKNEVKSKEKSKGNGKMFVFIFYMIIILAILFFMIKYFFNGSLPQIS